MCDPQTFDSRDSRYKRPYGAVPSGTRVELALRPPRAGGFSAATLIAYFEHRDEERRELPMPWRGLEGDRDVFAVTLETGDYVGLVWYSFRLEGLDGRREELGPFQLTVYDGAEEVPAWFGEGVTYQIFPDRFRRTRGPDPTGTVGGRSVHTGWEEEPVYRPDSNGEVRNRDFFGGDLAGVREKLGYLRGLGVDTLYFCPIFEAPENHRYGTGDYEKIDPMLGTEADFRALCAEAHALGMRVVLDGVFNHQGFVSRYFNGDGSYESVGESSPRTALITPGTTSHTGRTNTTPGGESTPSPPSTRPSRPTAGISSAARTASSATGWPPGRTAGGWTWPTSCPTTLSTASTPPPGRPSRRR